jgi:hypothetical protein
MLKFRLLLAAALLAAATVHATLLREKFASDPAQAGWLACGNTSLFQWDATNHVLDVTWDSSQPNSYFYHPLNRTYTNVDGFCVQFDLTLSDSVAVGAFELSIGLCNLAEANTTNFSRGYPVSPDLCEFDYFPTGPDSYGPTIDAGMVDSGNFFSVTEDVTQALENGVTYHVVLVHLPGSDFLTGTVYTNGLIMTALPKTYLESGFTGVFNLDTLAVMSFTSLNEPWGDSLLAHGTVGDLSFASPLPIGLATATGIGAVQFGSDTNWLYTLEQDTNFQSWTPATAPTPGNGTNLWLTSTNPPADGAFYRVRATLP